MKPHKLSGLPGHPNLNLNIIKHNKATILTMITILITLNNFVVKTILLTKTKQNLQKPTKLAISIQMIITKETIGNFTVEYLKPKTIITFEKP